MTCRFILTFPGLGDLATGELLPSRAEGGLRSLGGEEERTLAPEVQVHDGCVVRRGVE